MKRTILTAVCLTGLAGCSGFQSVTEWMLGGPSAERQIREAFDTEDADKRREGVLALSRRRGGLEEPYLKAYALLTEDPDPLVRCTAVGALGRSGDPKYLGTILGLVRSDGDPRVRVDAADALDNVHGDMAVELLRDLAATDPDQDIRVRCVRALRHYKSRDVLTTLIRALDDQAYGVRYAARRSLEAMTGRDAAYDAGQWRRMLAAADDPFTHSDSPKRGWWRLW